MEELSFLDSFSIYGYLFSEGIITPICMDSKTDTGPNLTDKSQMESQAFDMEELIRRLWHGREKSKGSSFGKRGVYGWLLLGLHQSHQKQFQAFGHDSQPNAKIKIGQVAGQTTDSTQE